MAQANLANQINTAERLGRIEAHLETVLRKIDNLPPSDACMIQHASIAVIVSELKSNDTAHTLLATGLSSRVAHLESFEDSITQKIAYVSGAFAIVIAGGSYLISWLYNAIMRGN